MATYVFKLIVQSGNDEFWESDPSANEVKKVLEESLEQAGFSVADYVEIIPVSILFE